MNEAKKPTILMILDGWGVAPPSRGNAISMAKKPNLDRLYSLYPSTVLGATGKNVGLEGNKMSGSEAGHLNIGAGRIVKQDSYYITESIKNGTFFKNEAFVGAVQHVEKNKSRLHLLGLMSNEDSPHSDPEHFRALLKLAKINGIEEVFCHFFTDGRDSYPQSALENLAHFKKIMEEEGVGRIATLGGRFYGMDRTKIWKRIILAYDAMVYGRGGQANSPEEIIENAYKNGIKDEYIFPSVVMENDKPLAQIKESDAVIFFNLRSDRARQFSKLFVAVNNQKIIEEDMPIVDRIKNLYFVAMTSFGPDLDIHTAFMDKEVSHTLPVALQSLRQLYISETEKFAHITYFFNGGFANPIGGEERKILKSKKVNSYADFPEMDAREITKEVCDSIENDKYDFIALNFPNADMVGHTGDLKATIKAVEILDDQIGIISELVLKKGGNLIITADHGNADVMIDFNSDQPNTFHTKNPVPFVLVSDKYKENKLKGGGILGNIAPTILHILEIPKPALMNLDSLLED